MLLRQVMQLSNIKNNKGFTLLELLVVVAIIGILSAIVIYSVQDARNKSADAYIKQNLKTVQTQAEIYFQQYKSYFQNGGSSGGKCPNYKEEYFYPNLFQLDSIIKLALVEASKKISNPDFAGSTFCGVNEKGWVAAIRLKTSPTENDGNDRGWCVDSSGNSKEIAGPISAGTLAEYNPLPTYKCP